ncbi:hypothetical protein HOP50_12g66780 [Chloropicon primus]|uniref:DUF4605 domain-containing protein n=1 Tax=Chloropicon primus TaxID=1764295 RepID=A0A5B8MXE3_9CHLO|nr:hypothetical protein A3770_12p66580 [Chloropicon primus]UPR03349.1 hypothetical protein HOP50_12g66780 [Chloropicon primus]|eukprot:QDZ24140.1 hypothetical protein A3770_12p66580 [Chloropicon primus]
MVRILENGEIVPDDDPRAQGMRQSASASTTLPNAPLPSPPAVTHRRRGASGASASGGSGSGGGWKGRESSSGSSGFKVVHRGGTFMGLPDVEFLGTRFQAIHVLLVVGSFFFLGWRGIFVALLVWLLSVQPNSQTAKHRDGSSAVRGGSRTPSRAANKSSSSNKRLFTGKGHRLGSE